MTRTLPPKRKTPAVLAAVLSLTALLTIVASSAAAAPEKYEFTHFKVAVKGVQKTTESIHHKPESECDVSDMSSITEKVVFQSVPKVMTFYHVPGQLNPDTMFDQAGKWITAAKVTRSYTPRIVTPPPSPQCGENDGGESQAPVYDCGTKKVPDWEVSLEFDKRRKDGLYISGGDHADPFSNCLAPLGDLSFPFLILDDTNDKPIVADLPQDELFDPGIGKLIVLAHGTKRVEEPDVSAKVSIEWDVSLTRVGGVKTS